MNFLSGLAKFGEKMPVLGPAIQEKAKQILGIHGLNEITRTQFR